VGRPRLYPDDVILDALRAAAEEDGRPPAYQRWLRDKRRPHPTIILKHFGSWNNAMAAAGLPVTPQGRPPKRKPKT
jgi:hypothetical protein